MADVTEDEIAEQGVLRPYPHEDGWAVNTCAFNNYHRVTFSSEELAREFVLGYVLEKRKIERRIFDAIMKGS